MCRSHHQEPVDSRVLKALEGRWVEFQFRGGHVVRARLIEFDETCVGNELIYDDLDVVEAGDVALNPNNLSAAAASFASLVSIREVRGPSCP